MKVAEHLHKQIQNTPEFPGIYKMLDHRGNIIYIGKAKNLKKRIASYFQKNLPRKITRILVQQIYSFDTIVTDTEKEALLLEDHLIKQNRPFFNIELRDNKTYPYLWLTINKGYPQLIKTRSRPPANRGYLFGPYSNVYELNMYIEVLHSLYPLKKCSQEKFPKNFKPCLYYDIGQCLDYCTGGVSREQMKGLLNEVKNTIDGSKKNKQVLSEKLNHKLSREIKHLNFEKAKVIKEQMQLLETFNHQQKILFRHENNFDIVEVELSDDFLIIVVLEFRMGRLSNKKTYECFTLPELYEQTKIDHWVETTLGKFIISYYSDHQRPILEEVIVPQLLKNVTSIEAEIVHYLKSNLDYDFTFKMLQPKKGKRYNLLKLAKANAKLSASEINRAKEKETYIKELKKILNLKTPPSSIESFDIANTGEQSIMAGMVRFVDGKKDKNNYRLFNIKSTREQDDFLSMSEAVYRRYKRLLQENKPFPDLVLIDGGKGQLSAAEKSLARLGVKNQMIVSLAKKEEELFVPKNKNPLKLDLQNPALFFLMSVRDETHRFVNTSHRRQRDKKTLESVLSSIPNIGAKKKQILNLHFESIEEIKNTTEEKICSLPYFSKKDFEAMQETLRNG